MTTSDNKASTKDIEKAMANFMKNAAMPAGMIPPLMNMMGQMPMMPNGMAPVMQMPVQMAQQMPAVPQMTAQQMYAIQSNPMNSQQAMLQGNKSVMGLNCQVRLGKAKERIWGVCKDCAKATNENDGLWCNALGIRTKAESGKTEIEIDVGGKKQTAVDATNSCRHFTPIK